ncbi:WhiB family transcriptional regulator [Aeromicrobium sp. CTD01-1L150]|uniref:WhiB family transcriptional regulator n=1 Tax=Aeromicrobium sp. CTD01-1L150 TaxID=3341830 RepID=UPI0035BF3C39
MREPIERMEALGRLLAEISRHQDNGEQAPCVHRERGHLWLSEDPDEQEAASHACLTACPAFAACQTYVTAHPEPSGVWAGIHREQTPLKRKKKTP